jgi:YesN/AraC family two-component response regulator
MPGMNGLEAAEKIREKDLHSSIVFLTAFDEFDYAKRAISLRALDYLLKPGEDKELIAVLEEAIRIEEEHSRLGKDIFPTMQALAAERDAKEDVPENALPERGKMRVVSESILKYIDEHYKEDISLQDVAGMLHYSDAYFCKIFKHCFDKNFIVYLTEYRIEKAKLLLADVVINIKDVSQEVGYRDSNYFTKVFKRMVGVTPSEYRTQILCRQETEEKK